MQKTISRLVITTLLIGSAVFLWACSGSESQSDDGDVAVSFNIDEPKIKERLGEDDGYAFAVFYGADTHGSLETCG